MILFSFSRVSIGTERNPRKCCSSLGLIQNAAMSKAHALERERGAARVVLSLTFGGLCSAVDLRWPESCIRPFYGNHGDGRQGGFWGVFFLRVGGLLAVFAGVIYTRHLRKHLVERVCEEGGAPYAGTTGLEAAASSSPAAGIPPCA